MAGLWQGGVQVLNINNGNVLLAHLQTAAYERFQEGKGFFITFFGGTDNDGRPVPPSALWCPAEVPLRFTYDEYDESIEIDREAVDLYLKAMRDPIGVIIGPGRAFKWPFTLLHTERPGPPGED
jgi:hypothetical protein